MTASKKNSFHGDAVALIAGEIEKEEKAERIRLAKEKASESEEEVEQATEEEEEQDTEEEEEQDTEEEEQDTETEQEEED